MGYGEVREILGFDLVDTGTRSARRDGLYAARGMRGACGMVAGGLRGGSDHGFLRGVPRGIGQGGHTFRAVPIGPYL